MPMMGSISKLIGAKVGLANEPKSTKLLVSKGLLWQFSDGSHSSMRNFFISSYRYENYYFIS